MKNLNVKPVTQKELEQKWSVKLPASFYLRELFIRCNKKGEVNWEVTPVYTKEELEKRGDYTILILLDINEFIGSSLIEQFSNFGYQSDKPCLVCKCTNTVIEPRFGYAVCIEHFKMSPIEIQKLTDRSLKPTEFVKMLEENLDVLKSKEIK
jgi:hypothetical protein